MQLFYDSEFTEATENYRLGREESKHLIKVLRKKAGDLVQITNGKGLLADAFIAVADENKAQLKITTKQTVASRNYGVELYLAPTKMTDRLEWLLEKATEIGFEKFQPILCSRSERKELKIERLQKTVVSALKQSGQAHLPEISEIQKFQHAIANCSAEQKYICYCGTGDKIELFHDLKAQKTTAIFIGPEGDFTAEEVAFAVEHGFKTVSLGANRLRTETAGLAAIMAFNLKNL
jgi:16S rRNA (uracil1498-N3)-methyltransferase